MSLHREDYAKGAAQFVEYLRAHQSLTLIVGGILAGIIVTLFFTLG